MHYTILSISDRFIDQVTRTKSILNENGYKFCNVEAFDGIKRNPFDEFKRRRISLCTENMMYPMRPQQAGCWLSHINALEYIHKNKIPSLLVLEDDSFLNDHFIEIINLAVKELPKNYDFLSLFNFKNTDLPLESSIADKKYIEFSYPQRWSTLGTIYSYSMAKKMIMYLKKQCIDYPVDDVIFKMAREDKVLNGFRIRKEMPEIISDLDPGRIHTTLGYDPV
jgi:GR25 family glycosyltransferase involved in LPS biosynthesis